MKKLLLLLGIMPMAVLCQNARQPLAVRYTGLGAYSTNFVDIFSGTSNQAALARLKSGGLGAYGERRFMLSELNQYSAIIAQPTSSGTFAFQADYFGSSAFNENQLGLAYARQLSSQVDVGVKFNYQTYTIGGYGNASAINFEAGSIVHLTERVHAGFHIYNPFNSKFNKNSNEKLPGIFKTGIGYEVSQQFIISGEVVKQQDLPVSVNMGFQYNIQQSVLVRAGLSTLGNSSYAGVGLRFGQLRLDVSAGYHPQLGFTPGLLLLYNFKKEESN